MQEPVGTYKCRACEQVCDGSEVRMDRTGFGGSRWACPDIYCDGTMGKLSDLPKAEWERTQLK